MAALDKLTLTDTTRAGGYDPVRVRRRKLAAAIQDQIELLDAEERGGQYRKTVASRVRDLETDEVHEVQRQRRVVPWWWTDDDGVTRFSIRYGSTALKLKGGKSTVVLKAKGDLKPILIELRSEALAGRLDEALNSAASDLRIRFGRERAPGSP